MTGKVKCTCGWSWNKSDSSKKDMYICHECGRDNSNNMRNGGWLDSYADGGTMQEHQENYNDYKVSAPEGFQGDGYSNVGRNSSPAWGGQFKNGGETDPPRRRVITESTGVYKKPFNEKELKNIIKDEVEYKRTGTLKKPRAEANKFEKYLPTKETVDFFKNLKKDNTSAVFREALKIQHERGNPSINVGTDKGLPFANKKNYNPFTNEINIPKSEYRGNIDNYIEEVSHAGQPLSDVIPRFLTNDIPGYIKAYASEGDIDDNINKYVYNNPNAVENYTHKKIQPELNKRIDRTYSFPMTKEAEEEYLDLMLKYDLDKKQTGGSVYPVNYVPEAQGGKQLTFLQPTSDKLPEGYRIPYSDPSSERAMSIGGEDGEPSYLIPSFKYGKPLNDPMGEFRKTGEHLGGPFKTWQEADEWENETRHPAVERKETIMFPQEKFQMGGVMPGAVGHMYARTGSPSKGPRRNQTDVTDASAQNGKEMQYYQQGLDWKPKTISKNGAWLDNYEEAQTGKSVKFDPKKFAEDKKSNTPLQKSIDKESISEDKRRWFDTKEYKDQVKANKAAEDKAILQDRKDRTNKSVAAQKKSFTKDNWRQQLADETQATGDKFRIFPEDPDSFIDEWMNPGVMIGNMASDLGSAPLRAQQEDSYMPYVTSIGVPLLTGGLEGIGAKTTGQFVSNLVNPLNIVPGYKSAERAIGQQLGNVRTSIAPELRQGLRTNGPSFGSSADDVSRGFQSGINTLEELPPLPEDFLTKLKKLQESSKATNMLKQDLVDPETIRRAETLGINPEIFEEASKNMTYSTSRDFPSSYSSSNLEININPNQTGRSAEEAIMSGVMNSHSPNFTANEIGAHELGHFFQDTNYWKNPYPKTISGFDRVMAHAKDLDGKPLSNILDYHSKYSTRDTAPTKVDEMLKDLEIRTGLDKEYYPQKNKNYFVDANKQYGTDVDNMIEKFPMFREYRQGMRDSGILKNKWDEITPEHIEDFKKLKPENRLNSIMEFNDKNYKLLNEVSKIAPAALPIGLGLGAASQLEQKKHGGIIKDDRGQWDHPGEITEIGSNEITMEGVPYDVLGISDTGDTKLMEPGKNYKFKGKKVTEFPMAKNGLRQEQKGLQNLEDLTNFTNYNKPTNWLNKYN